MNVQTRDKIIIKKSDMFPKTYCDLISTEENFAGFS